MHDAVVTVAAAGRLGRGDHGALLRVQTLFDVLTITAVGGARAVRLRLGNLFTVSRKSLLNFFVDLDFIFGLRFLDLDSDV